MKEGYGFFERKRRVITAFVAILGILFAAFSYDSRAHAGILELGLDIGGIALVAAGVLGRLWSTLYIGGLKNEKLVTTGPYSMCRNPLYLFSFLAGLGVCMAFENLYLVGFYIAVFAVYYPGVISSEEKRLRGFFGEEFDAFIKSTPAFFPNIFKLRLGGMPKLQKAILWSNFRDSSIFILLVVVAFVFGMLQEHGVIPVWRLP